MEGVSVRKIKNICVFCGANSGKDVAFVNAAFHLGEVLGKRKIDLVYGGGKLGLMGCVSTAVAQHERQVLGIIPSAFTVNNLVGETCGKEIKVATMQERLVMMMELSDAFIALPGGFGTLEELFQMISWAQLSIHNKPIGVLNINGFFNGLLSFVDHAVKQEFITPRARKILISATTADELVDKLQAFRFESDPALSKLKWSPSSSQKEKLDLTLRL
ncbi:hypothetical protein PTKIN_Ptkin04bG0075700 [Pterospermum kingtungense]